MAATSTYPVQNAVKGGGDVLIMAYYYLSLSDSGAARPSRFAKYLSRSGAGVQVVTEGNRPERQPDGVHIRCTNSPEERSHPITIATSKLASHIQRRLLPYNESLPWVPHAVEAGADLIRRGRVKSILSTSPPLATHFAAWELKRRFGIRWVADFRDPLSDNPFRNRRFARPYDALVERGLFRSADCIVANTDNVAELWRNRYPKWAHKIHVIWNGYDPEDRLEAAPLPPRPWNVVTHVGSLYGHRRPGVMLHSLVRLIESGRLDPKKFRLRLIGPYESSEGESRQPPFATLVSLGCLECISQTVPAAQARQEMLDADRLLLLDLNENGSALQVPGKIFEYVRIGRPIFAFTPAKSPVERILSSAGVRNRCIDPIAANPDIDRAVLEFLSLPSDPRPPSDWFLHQFDGRAQAAVLKDLLEIGQ